VGTALGAAIAGHRGPPIAGFGAATKVTYDPGLEIMPALSPDGRSVAYAAGTSAALRIFVRQVTGGRAIPLTGDSSEVEWEPYWSADGSRILFLTRGGVFSASSSGGDVRPEIPAPVGRTISSAEWSRDGKTIAYVEGDSLFLWANQRRARLVATAPQSLALCRWSPDATLIACAAGNPGYLDPGVLFANLSPSRILVVRVADGRTAAVTDSVSLNQSPVWSYDGRWLYFISDRDGPRDLFALRIRGGGHAEGAPIRLTTGLGTQSVSFSADGSRLAYAPLTATSNIWSMPIPVHPPVSAAGAIQITSGDQIIEAPFLSRDNKWLLYSSDVTGRAQVYRIALPGGAPERLTNDPYDDYMNGLSPDGREVAFHSWRTGSRDIYVQPLDGRPVQQVTSSPRQESGASWSPDGLALAYSDQDRPGGVFVVRRGPDGSWRSPTERAAAGFWPVWSPDGRRLAYSSSLLGGGVWLVPADSGAPRLVFDPVRSGDPKAEQVIWSAGGRTLYFKSHDARGNASIWQVAAVGGPPKLLVRFDDPTRPSYRQALAVGGGRFYFEVEDRQSDVYVMDVERR
jgi:Tol biopolymer transport system component